MFKFIKENSYLIFKMMVNQLGMMMFGMVLSLATAQNDTLLLITSVFSVLFYMTLLYMMTWEYGSKEKVRIDGGRIKYQPLKGLYMSILANSINIIVTIFLYIGYFNITDMSAVQPQWAYNMYWVARYILIVIEAMYSGMISLYSPYNPIAFALILLPSFITCTVGYLLGVKDIKITRLIGLSK